MTTLRVLIVEDYRDTADLLALWVTSESHDVKVCRTGYQTQEALRSYQPNVVLLDIGLPDMDGWELAPLIRRQHPTTRIVAVTAYQFPEDRQRSMDAGFDLHLGKPILREQVLQLLAETR